MTTAENYLQDGDIVTILRDVERITIAPGVSYSNSGKKMGTGPVTVVAGDPSKGTVSRFAVDLVDETKIFDAADKSFEFTVERYANILPDADYITWAYDHAQHVAFRTGHPANGAWIYNGKQMGAQALQEIIGDSRIHVLVLRDQD
jgi:hypothetical protein